MLFIRTINRETSSLAGFIKLILIKWISKIENLNLNCLSYRTSWIKKSLEFPESNTRKKIRNEQLTIDLLLLNFLILAKSPAENVGEISLLIVFMLLAMRTVLKRSENKENFIKYHKTQRFAKLSPMSAKDNNLPNLRFIIYTPNVLISPTTGF